ncbi:MAG: anti-sigma factor antagonist [Oscillospiraceae bacterium]|jgi:stage II sporulation protein AA (anti-sigma F factor antagonist)|nr:anti-sigma factor antagonist [Oscillospiraceae bacterium]MCI8758115.1 anti-sigma factor antagonist [Oscillospiraceae bacterium]MCI9563009.1 anti-sigma factor antagonist [Oscillospiraceae bacterium]
MEMKYKAENRQLTITLTGELDHHAAKGLMEAIDRCMEQNLPVKTLLDLGGLTFMDSSGIAVVLRAKRRMEALAGALVVVNIPRQAARVLETAGLDRYVDLI